MHIIDVMDDIVDNLPGLEPSQLAEVYNLLVAKGLLPNNIKPGDEESHFVLEEEDEDR